MRRPLLLLATCLLAACASSRAGQDDAASNPARRGSQANQRFPNPVTLLLAARDTLQLNELQIGSMQEIESELQKQNDPLIRQLPTGRQGGRPGGGMGGGRGGGMGGPRGGGRGGPPSGGGNEQMREVMQRIEQNNGRALDRVYAVLTEPQRELARTILESRRPRNADPRQRGTRP